MAYVSHPDRSVEPVFEAGEALAGHTDRFMFDTPFTMDGQSYAANIADQCVRYLDFFVL